MDRRSSLNGTELHLSTEAQQVMCRGFAILITFQDEPKPTEMVAFGIALQKLDWTVHDIELRSDEDNMWPDEHDLNLTQQLRNKFQALGPVAGKEGSGEKLIIFYAGYAMTHPEHAALGTWHTRPIKARCGKHIARADPEELFRYLIRRTQYDILFLLNCPFDAGDTYLDLISTLRQRSENDARTVQHIILKEKYTEHEGKGSCKHWSCGRDGGLLQIPPLDNNAIEALTELLGRAHEKTDRYTAANLKAAVHNHAAKFNGRPWYAINPGGREFVLWERKKASLE